MHYAGLEEKSSALILIFHLLQIHQMDDEFTAEGLPLNVIWIGLVILVFALFFLLLLLWALKAKLIPRMKTKSERKTKTISNQTKQRRSSKTDLHLKAKPRSVRADVKTDSPKDHSYRDRNHKDYSHKEHNKELKDQPIREDSSPEQPQKANKVPEVATAIEEESKSPAALDQSTSSLKLDHSVRTETSYPESQSARPSATTCKMDSGYLANLNALGGNDSSGLTVKRDLHETLYKQNVSLFSIEDETSSELTNKDASTLSTSFKTLNETKKV